MSLHAASYKRPRLATDLIVVEPEQSLSRESVALAGKAEARDVIIGTVLAEVSAGRFTEIDFAANDGTQNAAAVAVVNTRVPAGADAPSVIIDSLAVLNSATLVWPDGATDVQKTTALAALKQFNIKTR